MRLILFFFFTNLLFASSPLPTYFEYDTSELQCLTTTLSLDPGAVESKKEEIAQILCAKTTSNITWFRFYTYLAVAERDAAFLSYNLTGAFKGTLEPLLIALVKLFFPDCDPQLSSPSDLFSDRLCSLVFEKFKTWHEKIYPLASAPNYQSDPLWYPREVDAIPIPPPQPITAKEWRKFEKMRQQMSGQQEYAAVAWSDFGNPCRNALTWLNILDERLNDRHLCYQQLLEIRAFYMMALFDASEGAFRAKFLYDQKRPSMLDPSLCLLIPSPHSPSYPSSHAALAGAAAEVLSFYFPKETKQWYRLARECALSRVWAGVHFPRDIAAGLDYGKRVGKKLVSNRASHYP